MYITGILGVTQFFNMHATGDSVTHMSSFITIFGANSQNMLTPVQDSSAVDNRATCALC